MERKEVSDEQWKETFNKLKDLIIGHPYLEEKEFNIFENNYNFIMGNISQFRRLPVKDYYHSLELYTNYGNVHTAQSHYKEALKIADFFQDIADEIKGERKTKEKIKEENERLFQEEFQTLNSKYDDLVTKFDALKKIDSNIDRLEISEYKKKAQKDQRIIETIVGTVADNANAGRYIRYANNAKRWAIVWFLFGLSLMIYISGTVFASFVANISFNDWGGVLPRVLTLFVVLLPALFMMREAKKQRDKSFQFKDMECRILTSGQFIDSLNLDKKEKDRLKAQLVKDLFGKPMEYCSDGGLPPIEQICEVIKTCLNKEGR